MVTLRQLACGWVWVIGSWCAPASALDITYQPVDLADPVAGLDRWRYDYTLSGSLGEFEGVNLLFDAATRGALQIVTLPDPTALGVFVEQPNAALNADGLLTMTAVRPIVGERLTFSIAFDSLVAGKPGAQNYEIFDADFVLVSTAVATAVPEPATAVLFLGALALLAPAMRRRLVAKG